MTYFKIGSRDYSAYTNALKVITESRYNEQVNAAGDSVVDFINSKRTIEVGIIPLDDAMLKTLMADIAAFNVNISFLNPNTKALENNVSCIIPASEVSYYTIQTGNVKTQALTLSFQEL